MDFLTLQVATTVTDTPPSTWIGIAAGVLVIVAPLAVVLTRWANTRIARAELELERLKSVRTEVAATVIAAIMPNEIFKILYVGDTAQNQIDMVKIFRVAGIKNQIITLDSAQAGFAYLKEHPSVLFAIIYVIDIAKGTAFLDMVMNDDATKNVSVFFIDGNDPATALAAYQGGGAGMLKEPLDFNALLGLLNKQNLTVTIEKVK